MERPTRRTTACPFPLRRTPKLILEDEIRLGSRHFQVPCSSGAQAFWKSFNCYCFCFLIHVSGFSLGDCRSWTSVCWGSYCLQHFAPTCLCKKLSADFILQVLTPSLLRRPVHLLKRFSIWNFVLIEPLVMAALFANVLAAFVSHDILKTHL